MLNINRVFFIFGILVHSQRSSMYAASVILLQILYQGQLHAMRDFILWYGFQYYGFLWFSSALLHNWKGVLLIISSSQLTLYYSEWVSLLKLWQYSFISRHQVSIIMAPSENIYGRSAEMSQSWVYHSVNLWVLPSVTHILIGIILVPTLSVFIFPLSKFRGRNFCKVDGM